MCMLMHQLMHMHTYSTIAEAEFVNIFTCSYAVVVQNSAGVSTFYATLNTSIIPEGKLHTAKILHN